MVVWEVYIQSTMPLHTCRAESVAKTSSRCIHSTVYSLSRTVSQCNFSYTVHTVHQIGFLGIHWSYWSEIQSPIWGWSSARMSSTDSRPAISWHKVIHVASCCNMLHLQSKLRWFGCNHPGIVRHRLVAVHCPILEIYGRHEGRNLRFGFSLMM